MTETEPDVKHPEIAGNDLSTMTLEQPDGEYLCLYDGEAYVASTVSVAVGNGAMR